jgi:CubicO group peptidase (beta-lactamase class C family)
MTTALENLDAPTHQRVDELLIAACNERSLAGLAAGIVKDGRVVYARGFGFADAQHNIHVTRDTSFRIGSISKTLTAIGLMQLFEQGRFKLDDPVNSHLRAYKIAQPAQSPPVTFRHLLTHTSGIGEVRRFSDLVRPTLGLACKPGSIPTLRDYYAPALKAEVAPGTKWAYANHGFATLGQLVEDISGEPFAQYMRDHVFAALGMEHTDYLLSERVGTTLAQGYRMRRRGLQPVPYREIVPGPAGSVFSSVNEMVKYLAALLGGGANDSGRIIKADTLATMMTQHYQLDPRLTAVGLAFMIDQVDGMRIIGHGGGWPGFTSSMRLAPDQGVGVVVLTNTSTSPTDAIAFSLIRQALEVGEQWSAKAILEQPTLWKELCGTYRPAKGFNTNLRIWMLGGAARIFVRRGQLMIGGRHPFGPVRRGLRLHAADPSDPLLMRAELAGLRVTVLFKRDAAGRINTMNVAAGAGAFATLSKR